MQLGKCYSFHSLTTRKEGDRTVLTTAEIGQPSSLSLMTVRAEENLRRLVTGVQIVAKPRCPRCQAGQDRVAVVPVTLPGLLHPPARTAAYIITYSGVLIVVGRDGEERSMSFTNSAVFGFVRDPFLSSGAHDGPALEETVIAMPEVEVTVNADGLVVRFAAAVAESEATVVQSGQGNVPPASLSHRTRPDAEEASTSYAGDAEEASTSYAGDVEEVGRTVCGGLCFFSVVLRCAVFLFLHFVGMLHLPFCHFCIECFCT